MHEHYVMFRLKDEYRKDLEEVAKRLRGLQDSVPLIRKSEVFINQISGPHSYDVMFHAVFDDTAVSRRTCSIPTTCLCRNTSRPVLWWK